MRHRDDLFYDFDRDAWVARPAFVHSQWSERALPKPETPPAPGHWHRPPTRPSVRWRAAIRPLAAVGVGLGLPAVAVTGAGLGALAGLSVPVVGLAVAFGVWWLGAWGLLRAFPSHQAAEGLKARSADLCLLEDPDDRDVCLVEVVLVDRGFAVGADRGVVWFERGRLLFSGHRTSFAIGGEDVLPWREWPGRFGERAAKSLLDEALPLRHEWKAVCVQFVPLRHALDWALRAERFRERFRAFRNRPPSSRGPRQWPPFNPTR